MKEMIQIRQGALQQPGRAPRLEPQAQTGWGVMGEMRVGHTIVAQPH